MLRIPFVPHFDFSAFEDIFVREAFARQEGSDFAIYAGVQWNRWQSDELFWSERLGAYQGGAVSPLVTLTDLRLIGGTTSWIEPATGDETSNPSATSEPLLRLGSGGALVASSALHYEGFDNQSATAIEWALYSCAAGAVTLPDNGASFGIVSDGSYVLWGSAGGQWSAVRVRVGAGAWALAPGVFPGPGNPLYRKTGTASVAMTDANEAARRVVFDPLACMVSASCVLSSDIVVGEETVPAGALLLGGLRATERGPMSALWWLRDDGSATLLGGNLNYSSGLCECGKTNHFASDVGQAPDGTVYLLSECSCFRFEPGRARVVERLAPYPDRTGGEPGGNCLRFPQGEVTFWTENLTGAVDDGTSHYNRLVRRVGGVDAPGPSTLWHGTNCADSYLGKFWALRSDDNETLFLDYLDGGRWRNFSGLSRPIETHFWQRLKARGSDLYAFGFGIVGQTEVPRCAVADGFQLRDAHFPFFIRRATTCPKSGESDALLVVARSQEEGIGAAKRVIEVLPQSAGRLCALWNPGANAFRFTRAAFAAVGGDESKLPAYLVWQFLEGKNAGGVWRPAVAAPSSGYYLTRNTSLVTIIGYVAGSGGLPYDPTQWDAICFEILSDGSLRFDDGLEPSSTCTDASCALGRMPEGTLFRVIVRPVSSGGTPANSIQVTDGSDEGKLTLDRELYQSLWCRTDSSAPREELASYTQLLSYSRLTLLHRSARTSVEVVVLVSPENQPLRANELPLVSRRS